MKRKTPVLEQLCAGVERALAKPLATASSAAEEAGVRNRRQMKRADSNFLVAVKRSQVLRGGESRWRELQQPLRQIYGLPPAMIPSRACHDDLRPGVSAGIAQA